MLDSNVNDCSPSALTLQLGSALHELICPEACYSATWCSNTNNSFKGIRLPWRPSLALVHRADVYCFLLSFFFHSFSPRLSSSSCNAPFVRSSVTLVGSRCAGLEYTPTSALLCSRGGILAPTGCPWDNWHRTSCYWPSFFGAMLSVVKSFPVEKIIMFSCFVCVRPWLCHVTSHFNPHWLSCQQYI